MHRSYLLSGMLMLACTLASAQDQPSDKVSINGSARAVFFADDLDQELAVPDSITPPKENSGHTLADVGINIRPLDNIEIQGLIRVRNDFGGFWGSGITFDVRQLYVKGVIVDFLRYQLGDIDYALTPYTLYNAGERMSMHQPAAFDQYHELLRYDLFYSNTNNTWRQQGAAADMALTFSRFAKELEIGGVVTRQQPAGAGANERLMAGYYLQLLQSKYLTAGYHYVNLFDLAGTSANPVTFHNPVQTGTLQANYWLNKWTFGIKAEAGSSKTFYLEDVNAPELSDYFLDGTLEVKYLPLQLTGSLQYISIGPEFRSPGAQTRQLDFTTLPRAFDRITNDQLVRPLTLLDILRDAAVYNMRLSDQLMAFDPKYDNITPYGIATPNRQGVISKVAYTSREGAIQASAGYHLLSEIRGQGTSTLRTFSRLESDVVVNVQKFLKGYSNLLRVELHGRADNTQRDAEGNIPGVDLVTTDISIGLEAETFKQLDLIAGVRMMYYDGLEFTAVKDNYDNIIYFSEYAVTGNENMTAAGLRYRFTENIFVSGMFNSFNLEQPVSSIPPYRINSFAFIFKMDF